MPLYAALATGAFERAGIRIDLLPAVASAERVQRLRDGTVDLALMDLAAFVDATAEDPALGARCVFVLTQRLPMAAHVVADGPVRDLDELRTARYGGEADSPFVREHRALLRRLGNDDPDLRVDMPYGKLFTALPGGEIDAAPDYGALSTRYNRRAAPVRTLPLRYRDAGIEAYGIGYVASAAGLANHGDAIVATTGILRDAYQRMAEDPAATVDLAEPLLHPLDREEALGEWADEEAALVTGYAAATAGIGSHDADGWAVTAAWRAEVTQRPAAEPDRLA